MPNWKGIVGLGLEPEEFRQYVASLHFTGWRPQFVVLHNTALPAAQAVPPTAAALELPLCCRTRRK